MTRAWPHLRVPRAPVSRPNTSATGRPDRPDPCADPPTATLDPTRVMPAVPAGGSGTDPDEVTVAATVPCCSSRPPWLFTTAPTLVAVGTAVAMAASAGLVPTAADVVSPAAARTLLLPVAVAHTLVQVACAAAVLVSLPRRRTRAEVHA